MVAGCPKCSARYRVDAERIGPEGAKLRCTKCSAVFMVRAPRAASAEPVSAPKSPPSEVAAESEVDSARLVLVADPEEKRAKSTADAIRDWGLSPLIVHDGVEAMLTIVRKQPAVVILDAALPKMFGFQICEVVKRSDNLRDVKVILVGAIHHEDRYRRDASDLYGADFYIESPDLPDGLRPLLRDAGISIDDADASGPVFPEASTEPSFEPALESIPDTAPMDEPAAKPEESAAPAKTTEAEDPERTAERERAERLARIAVSEMVLYQPEKFDQATRAGTLEQALDLEIQEARALLRQRISEEVRAETDFIIDELNRVAQERGGQG